MPEIVENKIISKAKEILSKDKYVSTCWIGGAFATETADRFSDTDLMFTMQDSKFDDFISNIDSFILRIGKPLLTIVNRDLSTQDRKGYIVLFNNMKLFDFIIFRESKLELIMDRKYKILFDKKFLLGKKLREFLSRDIYSDEKIKEDLKWITSWFLFALWHLVRIIKREDKIELQYYLTDRREELARLIRLKYTPQKCEQSIYKLGKDIDKKTLEELLDVDGDFKDRDSFYLAIKRAIRLFHKYSAESHKKYNLSYPKKKEERILEYLTKNLDFNFKEY